MHIGDIIAEHRRKRRIQQRQMCNVIGISVSYLSQIENSRKKTSIKVLIDISEYLGTPLSSMLFEVLKDNDLILDGDRELFKQAQPMIEEMIKILAGE